MDMDFDDYGYNSVNDMWQDEESAGPENDDFRDYIFNNRPGFRTRGGYSQNHRFFGARGAPGHTGSRFMWGRGFGPAGPPMQQRFPRENKPLNYLIRCGVPKQNLRGLPAVLLRLMEPQYCGVCAQGFDNFAASRLHYICKNHTKNQKKWLQQAEAMSQRTKEVPLKSRVLYCELCDIHITSKSHAESHYDGRSHRAIVEGRKPPKNPFLLQTDMEDRVEQLIRREKKSLKPVKESEASTEVKKEPKSIPPELFCNICKTSVTCTEQMTMHLNGKRHLSKEKQHILKMMKGDTAANAAKAAETAEAAPKDDAGAQVAGTSDKKEQNYYEDEYDWGNGSGTWDDDPQ